MLATEVVDQPSLLEGLIGIDIPDYVLFIVIGVIVLVAIGFVAWGFVKEMKKK